MRRGWADLDGNGHYWPSQPSPASPTTPVDPLISPDFTGWWQRGTTLMTRIWRPALAVNLVAAVPMALVAVPVQITINHELASLRTATRLAEVTGALTATGLMLASTLVTFLLHVIAVLITAQLVILVATGRPPGIRAALATSVRRIPALIGWNAVTAVLTGAAFLCCVLPAFYFAVVLLVLPVVVLLEPGRGVGRCFQIFHVDFGASATRAGTLFGLGMACESLASVADFLTDPSIGLTDPGPILSTFQAVLSVLLYVVYGVLGTPLLVTAYADMRARTEPFSTAHLITPPTTRPAPPS
ncbi:hypothetical protein [Actinoplanes sp. NPDC051851]|uniref:hypothetical protein n=1 Tax=Actinoplanes sp. NPDC051851 TaxID=3154753 RepID=UPI0034151AC8